MLKNMYDSIPVYFPNLTLNNTAKMCADLTNILVSTVFRILKKNSLDGDVFKIEKLNKYTLFIFEIKL